MEGLKQRGRILIVDDEEVVRQLLIRTLQEEGYAVDAAEDGIIAFEKIKEIFFNLIITDLKMPKTNGMDVLKEIKRRNPFIEVIIITGYPTIESAVGAIKIGAFDFVCKPFDLQEMLSIVNRCLERQRFNISHIELSELMILCEVGRAITVAANLDLLLNRILDSALKLVKAERGSILLLDEKTKEFSIKVARGISEDAIRNTRMKIGEGICGRVAQEVRPPMTKSFLSIPLVSRHGLLQEDIIGVINVTGKISGEDFTEREQTLLSVLAGEAAVAIENNKIYIQLQDKIEALKKTISQLHQTQNQLIQTEKMAAVGQLASGIAHEIRNPLGIILGGVEFFENKLAKKKDKVTKESLKKIKQSIGRANNIVVDLLKLSRASQLQMQPVSVCKIMDEAASLINNPAYLNNVKINRNYKQRNTHIKADANMLRQAFFNLFINAIEAMPRGGKLSLSVRLGERQGTDDTKVVIEIADTGKGVSRDNLSKIFDPFFTTKELGKGTGLGLSIVHLILQRHNATIDVESRLGEGTKFTIRLPISKMKKGGKDEE
ncbi:MAG: response regulator [Candidatus Omnitrophota bacterium]|nr:response regulator [Candidatus Omnitrophota bacterium]